MATRSVELRVDGVTLRGLLWPGDHHGALLLHDVGSDLDSVAGIADDLATFGFTVLALDARGHGSSDGEAGTDGGAGEEPSPTQADAAESTVVDIRHALTLLRVQGARDLALVAVGAACVPALQLRREPDIGAMVLVSPDAATLQLPVGVPATEAAVIILVGGHDPDAATIAAALSERLTGAAAVSRLPTTDQAGALFHGALAGQATEQVRVFLARHRRA